MEDLFFQWTLKQMQEMQAVWVILRAVSRGWLTSDISVDVIIHVFLSKNTETTWVEDDAILKALLYWE